jgi:hypothetical protein
MTLAVIADSDLSWAFGLAVIEARRVRGRREAAVISVADPPSGLVCVLKESHSLVDH